MLDWGILLQLNKMAYRWFRPENIKSIPELFWQACQKYKEKTALIYLGKKISYRQLYCLSYSVAEFIKSKSLSESRVAILMPNLPQFVMCYFGALIAKQIVMPINFISIANDLRSRRVDEIQITPEIKAQIHDSRPRMIFVADFLYPILMQADISWECTIVVTSPADFLPFPLNFLYFLKAYKEGKYVSNFKPGVLKLKSELQDSYAVKLEPCSINQIAQFQYTGGTTGNPKAAMLTHRNLANNIFQAREALSDLITDGQEVVLGALPFFHIYGLTVAMAIPLLCLGGTVVIIPSFNPKLVIKSIRNYRISMFPGVNRMYQALVAEKDLMRKTDLSSLKLCISGAGPVDAGILSEFKNLAGATVVEGYGLSETSPVVSIAMPEDMASKKKSGVNMLGRPIPGTEVKILGDSGELLLQGEVGEITVRGPQVMAGYYNRSQETEAVLHNGWLRTGDIGYFDRDGCLFLTDRKKDVIKVMGENIYASEIENKIVKLQYINEVFVVGVPDKKRGETVVACVSVKPQVDPKLNYKNEIIPFLRLSGLSQYHIPSTILIFESFDQFKNPIGKILKRKLREEVMKKLFITD